MADDHGRDINDLAVYGREDLSVEWSHTGRGFAVGVFRDLYGQACSIQESSLADPAAIWLGVDPCRMHLTADQARDLAGILLSFARRRDLSGRAGDNHD